MGKRRATAWEWLNGNGWGMCADFISATGQRIRYVCWASFCCSGARSWRARTKLLVPEEEVWDAEEDMRIWRKQGEITWQLGSGVKFMGGWHLRRGVGGSSSRWLLGHRDTTSRKVIHK